ncbi:leucine-rich repeat-containing protein 74b-like [Plakobranchus ocellatus]|uniref:Leucine-rich repeat-containing protein 74b-like n=1 Tax=Plakobranchus ocellatus TaxID=259542 RepID=A0AAV4DM47_9GAST|nr:leucine-rich repeat-containing protein 74b-like [Plakobranchus ocellatus]
MEKTPEELPDWKIPPADEVLRRESFTQRKVEKRRSAKERQAVEFFSEEDCKVVSSEGFSAKSRPRTIHKSRSDNSIITIAAGDDKYGMSTASAGIEHEDKRKRPNTKRQGRTKSSGITRDSNVLKNRLRSADEANMETVFSDNLVQTFQNPDDLGMRKYSFPSRERSSYRSRPRSQSLHLTVSRPNTGTLQKSIFNESHPFKVNINSTTAQEDNNIEEKASGLALMNTSPVKDDSSEHLAKPNNICNEEAMGIDRGSPMSCASTTENESEADQMWSNNTGENVPENNCDDVTRTAEAQDLGTQDERGSSAYDTDCEPEDSAFHGTEGKAKMIREDVDIGHLTYETACSKFQVKPRRSILSQLRGPTLNLPHGGLLTAEIRALGPALKINSRVEEVDLSGNFLTPDSLTILSKAVISNVFIVNLKKKEERSVRGVLFVTTQLIAFQMLSCFLPDVLGSRHWLSINNACMIVLTPKDVSLTAPTGATRVYVEVVIEASEYTARVRATERRICAAAHTRYNCGAKLGKIMINNVNKRVCESDPNPSCSGVSRVQQIAPGRYPASACKIAIKQQLLTKNRL